ncbi:MAG: extracellular solute-binding protein, partial [Chitinivibrionales bacterium]|nr:extracellular solute-binding protein [Chitinivibrionales bacterium]
NHTVRMFYNKTLYRRIVGHDRPPATFEELVAVCEQVEAYADSIGKPIFPIAASSYQTEHIRDIYSDALNASIIPEVLDARYDLNGRGYEKFLSYLDGRVSFDDPEVRAGEMIHRDLARYYQPGFMATNRQEAGFAFAQQRALMISSGSWDYQSMAVQARDNGFEIGVLPFPLPTADNPTYGKWVDGQIAEENRTEVMFGLTRRSQHLDVALTFLKFITSKKINEEVNAIIGWIPSIRNTEVVEHMKPFLPQTEGIPPLHMPLTVVGGKFGKTWTTDAQRYWEFISGDIGYEEYIGAVEKRLVIDGMADMNQMLLEFEEGMLPMEHARSYYSVMRTFGDSEQMRADNAAKAVSVASGFVSRAFDHVDFGYRLYRITRDPANPRTEQLVRIPEYRSFLDYYQFEK